MIDPVPEGYVGLDEAVAQLAAHISHQEVSEEQKRLKKTVKQLNPAVLHWVKRELSVQKLHAALRDSALVGLVRDPVSGELFRLAATDWHSTVFWREIIVGGIVRAQGHEEIGRHDGRRVLIEASALDAWLKKLARCRPQPAEATCGAWLEEMMRASPERRPKPKAELRQEAQSEFGVSGRSFDRIWDDKLKITGANWGESGAPSKLPNN
jgi:hypothetical protein